MKYVVGAALIIAVMTGCESMQNWDPEIPQDKTTIGAATGGVLGAGLGAIVGNQTGDPGTGLVVGALAGAGTGAAIGNSLDEQDQALNQQDQAIKRQEAALSVHEREIQSVRGARGDYPRTASAGGYSASPRSYPVSPTRVDNMARNSAPNSSAREASPAPLHETNLVGSNNGALAEPPPAAKYAQEDWRARPRPNNSAADIQTAPKTDFETSNSNIGDTSKTMASAGDAGALGQGDDCAEAQREASKGDTAADSADKLFHFRRALRLCPSDPRLHNSLGKAYVKLNRKADAEFEFNEALNLNPSFDEARRNLDGIRGKG